MMDSAVHGGWAEPPDLPTPDLVSIEMLSGSVQTNVQKVTMKKYPRGKNKNRNSGMRPTFNIYVY